MQKFGESQTLNRLEDMRLLTGHGRYVDDIAPPDALHAHFLRAQVAHGRITSLDVSAAREVAGVHLVLTAGDLEAEGVNLGMKASIVKNRDGSRGAAPERPVLARGRVRFVGEPIAVIVAGTKQAARDGAEAIELEIDEAPVHVGLAPGGPDLHEEAPGNVAFDWALGDEEGVNGALEAAAHRVRLDLVHNRVIVNSMEPRGAFAEWRNDRLHLAYNGQGVWPEKEAMAEAFAIAPEAVHVTTPDVGGGFGMKAMPYPETVVISAAARRLGRPVRWMSERTEAMLSDNAGRDLIATAELGFDADHRITAYRVDILANLGAYNSNFGQFIQSEVSSKVAPGVYDIRKMFVRARGIYTNTTQTDAYRGAGRPEAIYTLERVMDRAARELGVSPFDLRRRNFIPADAFPYRTQAGETYDVGDFARIMGKVQSQADVAGFPARRAASEKAGRLRGLGLCYYIEAILGDGTEDAAVEFTEDGRARLFVGTQSNGQGHETVYAQFLSGQTGIPLEAIEIVQGDSDLIARGGGTGGSRSVTVQAAATQDCLVRMIEAFRPFLAEALEVEEDSLSFEDGTFRSEGSNRAPTLLEAAAMARRAGRSDLLRHETTYSLPGRSYPNGAHVAEVEIDRATGKTEVVRYTVTDDLGNLMHPRLAEGQVHGGVAQGVGQALTERPVFDEDGQLLTATFMDYALPRADDLPMIAFENEAVPSVMNPFGMKGCGEAGTVGALAAVANAVQDALWPLGVREVDMPFTPCRVWQMLNGATGEAA